MANSYPSLTEQFYLLLQLVMIAWIVQVINWGLCAGALNQAFGIHPRQLRGLPGVVMAAFLHGSSSSTGRYDHLTSNILAFVPLGFLILFQGGRLFTLVSIAVLLVSGLGTWLFGRSMVVGDRSVPHVGASGVIYGYLGFLLVYGITVGEWVAFVGGAIVLLFYRRSVLGILPHHPFVSWEMHLWGFLGGVLTALVISDIQLNAPELLYPG